MTIKQETCERMHPQIGWTGLFLWILPCVGFHNSVRYGGLMLQSMTTISGRGSPLKTKNPMNHNSNQDDILATLHNLQY
ncbi:hypothetical protein K439DRAFT_978487 [Ramaria rubella]|nr:hypothetical protein K439DRAFT_978487 [Ramaria rubella]